MYSFAQKKFTLLPFVVLTVSSGAVLIGILTTTKPQPPDQSPKLAIFRIGNAKSPFSEKISISDKESISSSLSASLERFSPFETPESSTDEIFCRNPKKWAFHVRC